MPRNITIMQTIEAINPGLLNRAVEWKESGMSNEKVARKLSDATGLDINSEIFRKWYNGRKAMP